ncbi:DUF5069 domain-containing protein [Candidatus Wolfebacteria bacterium]|nr:MAG: DUF5069 domain-containing protein [Candidatus Wolfebacteria bacterium]
MSKIVPLISSGTKGPLGVLHLPRFWQKVSLEAAGKLAEGYPACGMGYDQMVVDGLGLDKDETLGYIKRDKPTYPQFEVWVKAHGSKANDADAISKLNDSIIAFKHDDATRGSILKASGKLDDGSILDAVNLNNLDDWQEFHAAEIAA